MAQLVQRFHPVQWARGVFYGWWLVLFTGIFLSLVITPFFDTLSIWNVALKNEFSWSFTQLNLAWIFSRMEGGLLGPLEGWLTARFGTRRMIVVGMAVMGTGFMLFSLIHELWLFYLSFVMISFGVGLGTWLAMMTALNNWFVRKRTMAIGLSTLVTRLSAIPLVLLITWAVDPEAAHLGWRTTARVVGIVLYLLAIPAYLFVRNRPEDHGQLPDGVKPRGTVVSAQSAPPHAADEETDEPSFTVRQALRTSAFWNISIGHALTTMLNVALVANLALMFNDYKDEGLSTQLAGRVITIYLAAWTVFQAVGGSLGDRLPKNVVIFAFNSIMAGSVLFLTRVQSVPMAYVFAVLFGIGNGGRSPSITSIRGEYFGRKSFPMILGLSMVLMNVTLIAGPLLTGLYRDAKGSFILPFEVMVALTFVGGFFFLAARKPKLPTP